MFLLKYMVTPSCVFIAFINTWWHHHVYSFYQYTVTPSHVFILSLHGDTVTCIHFINTWWHRHVYSCYHYMVTPSRVFILSLHGDTVTCIHFINTWWHHHVYSFLSMYGDIVTYICKRMMIEPYDVLIYHWKSQRLANTTCVGSYYNMLWRQQCYV